LLLRQVLILTQGTVAEYVSFNMILLKTLFRISGLILLIFFVHSCKKDDDNTIKDGDGNVYTPFQIGAQIWLVENLRTTKYNDGKPIPQVKNAIQWSNLSIPAYCWYLNDSSIYSDMHIKDTYGALYNWYSVNTDNLCPLGWHVPNDNEWTALETYLTDNGYGYGGSGNNIGKPMAATSGWYWCPIAGTIGCDQASNNSSGFTAFPGGTRWDNGVFSSVGSNGYWWSATEYNGEEAWARNLNAADGRYSLSSIYKFPGGKKVGYSVRCLKD
jgi:uncharacterized protein (TIGR02145 family)